MKFIKEITPKGLLLPVTAARLAGFNAGDKVEYHTLDGAMLVLKGRMSAPELLAVVQQLTSTSAQLLHYLSEVCGPYEDCDKDSCPYNDFEEEAVQVNEYLREAAGIPDGAKLCAEVDEEAHTITVLAAEHRKRCGEAQIAAPPSFLLEQFAMDKDFRTLSALVEKGISGGGSSARTLHMLTYEGRYSWIAEELLEKRMWVDANDYSALHACVQNDAVEVCRLLLDGGMDFDQYRQWAQTRPCAGHEETLQALADHWSEMQAEVEQAPAQENGGMTLG